MYRQQARLDGKLMIIRAAGTLPAKACPSGSMAWLLATIMMMPRNSATSPSMTTTM